MEDLQLNMERECPRCHKKQIFKSKTGFQISVKKNSLCRACSKTGKNNPSFGMYPSYSIRKKISDFHSGKPKSESHKKKLSDGRIFSGIAKGKNNPFYGKHHTKETKEKLSETQLGPKSYNYRRKTSEETKRKMRISVLERMEKSGVAPCTDIGSDKFFGWMNKLGFNFKPKRFLDIGYYADGYDEIRHVWCEFDTPHHLQTHKKKKDVIRQNNIINYFEKINTLLKGFIRIQADKTGNVLGSKCVYKGRI